MIEAWTDASWSSRSNAGAWAVHLRWYRGAHLLAARSLCCGIRGGTSYGAELEAVWQAVQAVRSPAEDVTVFTDCKSIVDVMDMPESYWAQTRWCNSRGRRLDRRYNKLYAARGRLQALRIVWVKGHNDTALNEYVDSLAVATKDAMLGGRLKEGMVRARTDYRYTGGERIIKSNELRLKLDVDKTDFGV